MDAFSEMGPTVTDTLVTALTKLSSTQEAMDNRLDEMSRKFEERNTALTNQVENVQRIHTQNSSENQISRNQRGHSGYNRGQNSNQRGYRGGYRGRYQGNNRGYRGLSNYQRYRRNFNYSPRYSQPQNFNTDMNFNPPQNQTAQSVLKFNQPQATFEVFTPDANYMPYTQQSSITCHKCGYPNHLAPNCTLRGPAPRRGAQNPFNQVPKN